MREFKFFVEERLAETELNNDYWTQRLQQFQAASNGEKGAIADTRTGPGKYTPVTPAPTKTIDKPVEWIKNRDGMYEKPTAEDEAAGLSTLSRWNTPASNQSYYTRRSDGRYVIVRPQTRASTLTRK